MTCRAEDWKAGDVAQYDGSIDGRLVFTDRGWIDAEEGCARLPSAARLRRLVVIDPEDREQVERLEALMAAHNGWTLPHNAPRVGYMQAALREFATPTPPRPDEPTGLGGLVRYDGSEWVGLGRHRWQELPADDCVKPRRWMWADFPSDVMVLRAGWSE